MEEPVSFALELGEAIGADDERSFGRLPAIRWDSMGLHYIVYFPNVPYDGENDEEEDEDED